jgi:hypothetical protein
MIGGSPAGSGAVPGMLALINGKAHYGAAILIRRDQFGRAVALTAAHCLNYDLNTVTVRGGSLNWHSKGITAKVREYYVHPEYALPAGIDLAVLILDGALQDVAPVPALAGQDDGALYQTGASVTMAGWGPTEINGRSWDDLQALTLPLVHPGSCSTEDRASNADFACCRSNVGQTTPGDSGGPMIGGNKLVGVIEGGQGAASIATRVDKQATWIANPALVHSYVVDIGPRAVAVVPAAHRNYVLHNDGTVSMLDASWAALGKLQVTEAVHAIVGSPTGPSVYIADRKAVRSVNTGTNEVTGSIATANRPSILAITPDGAFLAVGHGKSVTILAAADLAIVKEFSIGTEPSAIAMAPDSQHVFVTNNEDTVVRTIDISTFAVTSWENGGYGNSYAAAAADRVYVAESSSAEVSVRDSNGDEQTTLDLGTYREVKSLAVEGTRLYVGYETTNSNPAQVGVSVFETGDNSHVCTRQLGAGPLGPLTPTAGAGVLAVNRTVSSISVVTA